MRLLTMRTKSVIPAVAAFSAALYLAGGALAATPQQIYRDAADGKLDAQYSQADLSRAAHSATLKGYGNQVVNIIIKTPRKHVFAPPRMRRPEPVRGTLPFTGSDLATFASLGIALVAGGFLLRLMARKPIYTK